MTVISQDKNKNVTLDRVKPHFKNVPGIIESCSSILNIKVIRNYSKNFGKLKSAMEHQKSKPKYAVLTIQAVSAAFLCLNEKYEITNFKEDNFLNKRTEIIKRETCRHRSKYKRVNCETIG